MGKSKSKTKRTTTRKRGVESLGGLSFDVEVRTDKLRAWLDQHPGEIPPGLTRERISTLLGN